MDIRREKKGQYNKIKKEKHFFTSAKDEMILVSFWGSERRKQIYNIYRYRYECTRCQRIYILIFLFFFVHLIRAVNFIILKKI